ncbi:MAG: hypothetical protein Marn2KO_33960 [Marinobacter nauticus]
MDGRQAGNVLELLVKWLKPAKTQPYSGQDRSPLKRHKLPIADQLSNLQQPNRAVSGATNTLSAI